MDANGNFYVSEFFTSMVHKFNNDFSTSPELVSEMHNVAADIFYNQLSDTLAVPNLGGNSVDFVYLGTSGIEDQNHNNFKLWPNPNQGEFFINISNLNLPLVELKVYDQAGRFVQKVMPELNVGNQIRINLKNQNLK